ncbi:uncharacterized protein LOC130825547 isoform X1 [Amaranthus tricolor]|uniref:uncharacterized protein LOC130825547 isoform X1 n=1 Tax=Amaranthus tricolor TaxID=29722 RepID=UPI0025881B1C|nr:uncharacterized protein LOC130825547 isoform X1 [Amaranthus tricolor]
MGKNQAYKAMQRSRVGSSNAAPEEIEDGLVDGSFHTPEWHAARLASLSTTHTVTWEEFKKKQKEDALKTGEIEADKDRMMRQYRAQLDAERERKLSHGRNHSSCNSKHRKGLSCLKYREKSSKRHTSKKRKHSRRKFSDSSSSSSSESSSSDDEERDSRRSKSRSKKPRKERKHRSRSKNSSSGDEASGPLPLSRFFGSVKSS